MKIKASIRHMAVAVLAFVVVAAAQSRILLEERTWFDEEYVLLESNGIAYFKEWPAQFRYADVMAEPTLGRVLHLLATQDAYPPLVHLVEFSLRPLGHPVLLLRCLFYLLGLVSVAVAAWCVWTSCEGAGFWPAWTIVGLSPALLQTASQIKWYALAVLAVTIAGAALLKLASGADRRWWLVYVIAASAALHAHYYCGWLVPAHGIFVLGWMRRRLGEFVAAMIAVSAICLPWYALGLPSQRDYVTHFFSFSGRVFDSWYQPFTAHAVTKWWIYAYEALIGFQPSPIRARYLVPVIAGSAMLLAAGWRGANLQVRRLVGLAAVQAGIALVAQTAHAARLGHTTPLTYAYFSHWVPLFMAAHVAVIVSVLSPRLRNLVIAALVVVALLNLNERHTPMTDATSLTSRAWVADRLSRTESFDRLVVFGSDTEAKMMSLYYKGPGWQAIWSPGHEHSIPASVQTLAILSPMNRPEVLPPPGWDRLGMVGGLGNTRFVSWRRAAPRAPA